MFEIKQIKLIICILIMIEFGPASAGVKGGDVEFLDLYNFISPIFDPRHTIYKCCPIGEYVMRGECIPHKEAKDFSKVKIYDKNNIINETGKSFDDLFRLSDGLFMKNDGKFKRDAANAKMIKAVTYLLEDGNLLLDMPNMYDRWVTRDSENFCIDYRIMANYKLIEDPVFWVTVPEDDFEDSHTVYLTVALLISCVFLLLVLIVYILLPELQNLHGMILMAYVSCLFNAFLLLMIIQSFIHGDNTCIGLTMGIYFCFLAAFCWMTVMSYDIWWTFRGYAKARSIHRRGEMFKFLMYGLCAFGVPLLMTIVLGILNTIDMTNWRWFVTPQVPFQGCFLEGGAKLLYLYMPMLILITANWVFYLMTAFNLWRLNRATAILDSAAAGTPAAHRTQMNRFKVYLKLTIVMGLNWLLEIISFVYPGFKVWYVTDVYNILIGFFIFLIFVCKKKIYRKLCKRYGRKSSSVFHPGLSKSYSSSSSSTESNQETISLQVCNNPKGNNTVMKNG